MNAMQVDVRREVVLEAVARVHAANVRAQRALQTARIVIVVEKIVVAESVGSKRFGSSRSRCQRRGRAAAPASEHLRRQQLLFVGSGAVRPQVAAKLSHPLMELRKAVGALRPSTSGIGGGN